MITLEPVKEENALMLYDLLRERSSEDDEYINISHRELPTYEEHLAYMKSEPYAHWLLIMDGVECVGSLNLTKRNEIGLVLYKKYRRQGYGTKALKLFLENYQPLPDAPNQASPNFVANINPKNKASIHLFQKFGFEHIQNTYVHH